MKKVMLVLAISGLAFAANAQNDKKGTKKEAKMEMKDHACTDACKKNGKCVMAHGEKGHTCSDECKKKM